MADDEGLPPPSVPGPRPAGPTRVEGVPEGLVKDSLGMTRDAMAPKIERWRGELNQAERAADFKFKAISGDGGASPVERLRLKGERLLTGTTLEAGEEALSFLGSPISFLTHDYQANKIDAMQEQFMKNYGPTLQAMSQDMGRIKRGLDQLSEIAAEALSLDGGEAQKIMEKKKVLGDRTMRNIDDRLRRAKTPEGREKLEAMKKDLSGWMADRDARVKREQPEVDEMSVRAQVLKTEGMLQSSRLAKAADLAEKAIGRRHTDPRLDYIEQTRPGVAIFAAGLRTHLLGARADIEQTLK